MATVYILYSKTLDKYYIGSCADLDQRLEEHTNKVFPDSFTRTVSDWELFYFLGGLEYKQARCIESHIKKMKSKKYIENLKIFVEISLKLKVKFK